MQKRVILPFLFVLFLFTCALITYRGILHFSFWKDDWILLWNGLYHPELFMGKWLHPATNIEFILLSRWFGKNPLLWHLFGIMLRSAAAGSVALMINKITKSVATGILSGMLFATSAIGLDAVGWPSAHVVLVALSFLCLGFSFFIDCVHKPSGRILILFVLWTSVGILADPWRALPVVFLFWLFIALFGSTRLVSFMRTMQIPSLVVLAIVVILFSLWHREVIWGTRLAIFLSHQWQHPLVVFGKMVLVNTYSNSLFNLVTGWILVLAEDGSTGVYNRVNALTGGIGLVTVTVWSLVGIKKRNKHARVVLFFVLWMLLFYLPNWLFEPAITVGATHRYLVISSVGFLGLIAYGATHMRPVFLAGLFTVCFIAANYLVVQQRLAFASRYRSAGVVDTVWNTIDHSVASTNGVKIFMYTGQDPLVTYVLNLSGSAPFALRRNIDDPNVFPIITADTEKILYYLCTQHPIVSVFGKDVRLDTGIAISNVFAWNLTNDGVLTDMSLSERTRLRSVADQRGCSLR